MILRNYYNILVALILANSKGPYTGNDAYGRGSLVVGRYNDASKLGWPYFGNKGEVMSLVNITGVNYNGIVFGTGTTPVTFNDQKLASIYEQISGANFSVGVPNFNDDTGKFEVMFSCVITNTGSNTVTLTEMGIVKPNFAYRYNVNNNGEFNTNGSTNYVMVYREILESPIVLAPNEAVAYTHKFEVGVPDLS